MIWMFLTLQIALGISAQDTIKSKFSCEGRVSGYYADVDTGCQVYHMCDGLGRQFSYSCPNTTLFQQRMLICDHWYMVNCSKSEVDYGANLLIGQREKPFVDDSDKKHPYHRTPRPDLLSHPSESEFNLIYRNSRAQFKSNFNLVGADVDTNDKSNPTTEGTVYFLPSHWSTRYTKSTTAATTEKRQPTSETRRRKPVRPTNNYNSPSNIVPNVRNITEVPVNFKSYFKNTTPVYPKYVNLSESQLKEDEVGLLPPLGTTNNFDSNLVPNVENITEAPVNFKSYFKNTTPVYPRYVNLSESQLKEDDVGLLPPIGTTNNFDSSPISNVENVTEMPVNFRSYFQNTTPVYPKYVNLSQSQLSENDVGLLPPRGGTSSYNLESTNSAPKEEITTEVPVNFKSYFKNTTPVYPKFVNLSELQLKENDVGLLPPLGNTETTVTESIVPALSLDFLPPEVDNSHLKRNDSETEVVPPSVFYQPPFFHPDYTEQKSEITESDSTFSASSSTLASLIISPSEGSKPPTGEKQWKNLREIFLIPDYDFPLDSVSRPGYDSEISSFQAKPVTTRRKK